MRVARLAFVLGSVLACGCFDVGGCELDDPCHTDAAVVDGRACSRVGLTCVDPNYFANCICVDMPPYTGPVWSCRPPDLSVPMTHAFDFAIVDGSTGD